MTLAGLACVSTAALAYSSGAIAVSEAAALHEGSMRRVISKGEIRPRDAGWAHSQGAVRTRESVEAFAVHKIMRHGILCGKWVI